MEGNKVLEWKEVRVDPENEFRFEVDFKETVHLKLKSGIAEIFGAELAVDLQYTFSGQKLAVFSWSGCVLEIAGQCTVDYTAGETPMNSYFLVHVALEQLREAAAASGGYGPKVMVVGPSDVGKSTLCRILLNYAVKAGRSSLFVDIDTNEGSLSIPGSMAASAVYKPIGPEEGFGSLPQTTGASPAVFYYGWGGPNEKAKLYDRIALKLAELVQRKLDDDPEVKAAGTIISTPYQFAESGGLTQLLTAVESFTPTAILVIGHERLYADLNRQLGDRISVVKLAKSGGVVTRDKAFRRQQQSACIREYFYGPAKNQLNPYTNVVSFNEIVVRRVGDNTLAPSSALPLGMERKVQETRVIKVEAGDILLNSVLAVSNADRLDAMPNLGASAPALTPEQETSLILDSSLAGFVYISDVDEAKHKVTILTPNPGRLPKKYMVMGSLKWLETM
ncbi:hypothetical protein HDU97_001181 [Phlyctochytrium planicorne]|nr:hypothetical protein HDU97_001181 [Phlyctochytrium planicorne]